MAVPGAHSGGGSQRLGDRNVATTVAVVSVAAPTTRKRRWSAAWLTPAA
jgi:hypothetical protein